MTQRERQDIRNSLCSKGFQVAEGKKHTKLIYHTKEGVRSSVMTILSRGSDYKTIGEPLLKRMTTQCKLEKKEDFLELVDCDMKQCEYENYLIEKKVIESADDSS